MEPNAERAISSPTKSPSERGPDWIPAPLYRLTVQRYEMLVAKGVLTARDQIHLVNGFLVAKKAHSDPRSTADELCGAALNRILPAGWHARASKPVRLPVQVSKPDPDRSVVRGEIRDYSRRTPGPGDVALVIEIADSSLAEDRKLARIYGASGIPIYWIINFVDRQIEVYTQPYPDGYHSRQDFGAGQAIPLVLDDAEVGRIAVDDILP